LKGYLSSEDEVGSHLHRKIKLLGIEVRPEN